MLVHRLAADEELLQEIVAMVLEQAPRLVTELQRGADQGDSPGVARAAHALKGMLLNVSASRAAELAGRIEAAARAGELADARTSLPALERALHALYEALQPHTA